MIAVVQRVLKSGVEVEGKTVSRISKGLLVFLGVKKGDREDNADTLAKKIAGLRIFPDKEGKMNLNVGDTGGEILVISQFTLCTDNSKSGNRPSFTFAEDPERANSLYEYFIGRLKAEYNAGKIFSGVFAAEMKVDILNDGPVTIILEK
ncbi:MAG: D-tyrosyl-tRNA(Tyr) deacylase [Ignavibacteriae bacterium]|nr:D-tyrosyl-tRNA(Tyr) deacylase [Ignavibacteriota bacterium]